MKCARTDSAKIVEDPHAVGVDVVVRRREDRPHADRLTAAFVSDKTSHGKRAKKEQANCDHNNGLVSVSQGKEGRLTRSWPRTASPTRSRRTGRNGPRYNARRCCAAPRAGCPSAGCLQGSGRLSATAISLRRMLLRWQLDIVAAYTIRPCSPRSRRRSRWRGCR